MVSAAQARALRKRPRTRPSLSLDGARAMRVHDQTRRERGAGEHSEQTRHRKRELRTQISPIPRAETANKSHSLRPGSGKAELLKTSKDRD